MLVPLSALALLCLAVVGWLTIDGVRAVLARARAERAQRTLLLRVSGRREVSDDHLCLTLAHPEGRTLPRFAPGQHLLLHAPAGRNGATIQRAYSLAAWEMVPKTYELGIKRERQGGMTSWLWSSLHEGDAVLVSRPQGRFVLKDGGGPVVLIAGGVGVTPMRAMLHMALSEKRRVMLFHAVRRVEGLLYREEFERLAARHANFSYLPQLSRPDIRWPGASGRLALPQLLEQVQAVLPPDQADYYLCAGAAMMETLSAGLVAAGISPARIHREAFCVAAGAGLAGLTIAVDQQDGMRCVETRGEPTLLASLEANGIDVPSECRTGSCGLCEVHLEHGDVEWLVEPEYRTRAGRVLPCVCVPKGALSIRLLDDGAPERENPRP